MLKIYETYHAFQVNRQAWELCGNSVFCCKEESEATQKILIDKCSFDDTLKKLMSNESGYNGLYYGKTLLTRRPYIELGGISRIGCPPACNRLFAKEVRTFSYKVFFQERKFVTLEWIMKHLTAEQAIQYFKDRGMSVCPIKF